VDITAEVMYSDLKSTGAFSCSDPIVNQIYQNALWGQRGNFLNVPTDCPQRDERLGWTGDAQVFCRTAAYNFDVRNFFRKWLGDLLALLSGIFYAGVFMLNSFEKGDALSSVFLGQLACGIFLSPMVLRETDFSAQVLFPVFLLGAVQVGLAYIFFTTGTKYTDPVTASIINALEPILNPILVAVFYGEMLGTFSLIGAAIVILGILYYNIKSIRSKA
jgi:drug/metabolite transporter (DMT)-like permease